LVVESSVAQGVADDLGRELYRIDLSQIISKYIGETEKNLGRLLDAPEARGAVLFFDEADALFGQRGEARTGTDRYANLEVSYLLQRIEEFDGLVILASNLHSQIDGAFLRRFHVSVRFPRPDPDERTALWRLAFPDRAPLSDELDLAALSTLDMTGASIASTARTAALLAADGESTRTARIEMRHLVLALDRQFKQEGRILRPAELGAHASLLGDER